MRTTFHIPHAVVGLCLLVAASAWSQEGRKETGTPEAKDSDEVLTPPRWFNASGTYGRNVLFWRSTERSDRSTAAVIVERREGKNGRWHEISPGIREVDRWFDEDVRPGESYSYRAYSLSGNRAVSSPPCDPQPRGTPASAHSAFTG